MKKVYLLLIVVTWFACNNETKNDITNQKQNSKKSYTDFSKPTYKGQLPYLKTPSNSDDSNTMALKYDFEYKIKDSNTSWEYFDKIFNDTLSVSNKQHISYIILSSKDLIGQFNKDKSNELLEKKLVFYTKVLVDSDYIGYCLLYYSFDALKSKYPGMVSDFKKKVINYSLRDVFHKEIINNKELEKSEMAIYYKKAKENYSYLKKIEDL